MSQLTIPVGGVPEAAFPPPASIEQGDGMEVRQSDRHRGVLRTRVPDPQVQPVVWVLGYQGIPSAVAALLRAHYRDHGERIWTWRHPIDGVDHYVRYAEPPQFQFHHRTSQAAAQVTLELATVHE